MRFAKRQADAGSETTFMRWIWIDRFLSFESGKSARALKNLSHAEDLFAAHFPGYPVMPATLILEGLAQTGGILVGEANDFKEKVVLAKITSARFQREALAGDVAAVWEGFLQGRSVIRRITLFDASGLPVRFGGEIRGFDAKRFMDRKEQKSRRMMARTIELAVAAASLAMKDSGVDKSRLDPTRFGIEFGAGLIAMELAELGDAASAATDGGTRTIDLPKWGREGVLT